jgi:DnaK suppressor protein
MRCALLQHSPLQPRSTVGAAVAVDTMRQPAHQARRTQRGGRMKQSMTKSARAAARVRPATQDKTAALALLKAVAAASVAKLAAALHKDQGAVPVLAGKPLSTRNPLPRRQTDAAATMREIVVKDAKSAPRPSDAKATSPSLAVDGGSTRTPPPGVAPEVASTVAQSGQLYRAKADTGTVVATVPGQQPGAVPAATDQFENSVVSKVSEVMTKTNKSTPAANTEVQIISEEEIRAMGEKDYMNPAQMAFFKARLQQLEKDLLKNAGETTEHLRETVLVPDPADRATIEEEHALELRTRDRERKLLKKVQQSIASIDAGDYGWCEETGEPIGIPRLIARPTATLSLEAQQRRELKQKLYGD